MPSLFLRLIIKVSDDNDKGDTRKGSLGHRLPSPRIGPARSGSDMAVGAFPAAKLGLVLIKQISKPIANGIASRAQKSKVFREFFCIPIAQLFHW